MTANELANEAMEHYKAESPRGFNVNWMKEVATMLRQQETTIEHYYQMLRDKDVEIEQLQDRLNEFLVARDLAILRKASEK